MWTDFWSSLVSSYPFSLHMAVHILVSQVVAPVFLLLIPLQLTNRVTRLPGVSYLLRGLRWWPLTWFVGMGGMWIWHLPSLHHAALSSSTVQIFQLVSFFATGLVFWWPIYTPLKRERMSAVPRAVFYLAAGCLGCTVLGILIAFAPPAFFAAPGVHLHSGINPWSSSDQKLGGLLMWVPGCLIYLTAIMLMFARWYGEPEERSTRLAAGTSY